ncbi:hypothetical protein BH18ACT4_BH18ACT4_13710 [soil metagenome]
MPAPTLRELVQPAVEPATLVILVAAVVLYIGGVRRLARRGRPWRRSRSFAFGAGVAVVAVATQSGIAGYDTVLFSVHMGQHLLLGMAGPLLFALSAPVTLALQASAPAQQRNLLRLVHSRPVAVLSHPVVGWVLFAATLFGLYFTPLFHLSLTNGLVHAAVHAHFLAVGCLFLWPLVGVDPVRWRLPDGARLLSVLLALPFHAFLGVALLGAGEPLAGGFYAEVARDWGPSVMADQRAAAGMLWAVGDVFALAAAAVVFVQWVARDEREAARLDRRLDDADASPALKVDGDRVLP